jgi:hypothetical protein
LSAKTGYDVVHVNAEFSDQASDHDPSVARFTFNPIAAAKARPDGVTDFMNQPRRFAN